MAKQNQNTSVTAAENAALKETVAALEKEVAELRRKLERMNELLLNAQRARFGRSSEKTAYVMEGGEQQQLFNEAELEQDAKAEEPAPAAPQPEEPAKTAEKR